MLPIFAPRQRPLQVSCIDHLTLWGPKGLSLQIGDVVTLPTAFLDHKGVMGSLQLPISIEPEIPPPIAQPPRVPTFRYPIPDHTLEEWKYKFAVDSHGPIELARAMG